MQCGAAAAGVGGAYEGLGRGCVGVGVLKAGVVVATHDSVT